jgi:hypothetical protein
VSSDLPQDPFEPDLSGLESLGPDWQALAVEFDGAGHDLNQLLAMSDFEEARRGVAALSDVRARLVLLRLIMRIKYETLSPEEWERWMKS